jgi:hypothetical protein
MFWNNVGSYLISYNDISIRASTNKENDLLSRYMRDSASVYDNAVSADDCRVLMRRIHQMTEAYSDLPSRPASPVGTRASSEFEGYQHANTSAVQADPKAEALAQRLQEKEEEIQKLKSSMGVLTYRLHEKDKEIFSLRDNSQRSDLWMETAKIQLLKMMHEEVTKLQDSNSVKEGSRMLNSRPSPKE